MKWRINLSTATCLMRRSKREGERERFRVFQLVTNHMPPSSSRGEQIVFVFGATLVVSLLETRRCDSSTNLWWMWYVRGCGTDVGGGNEWRCLLSTSSSVVYRRHLFTDCRVHVCVCTAHVWFPAIKSSTHCIIHEPNHDGMTEGNDWIVIVATDCSSKCFVFGIGVNLY